MGDESKFLMFQHGDGCLIIKRSSFKYITGFRDPNARDFEFHARVHFDCEEENDVEDFSFQFQSVEDLRRWTSAAESQLNSLSNDHSSMLNTSVASLFPVRVTNCLEESSIKTLRDLVKLQPKDLLQLRMFGESSLLEVFQILSSLGLHLGMKV